MKKRLEAELISIAHRILKLKNKSEVDLLLLETRKLYETLSVLKFVEENMGIVQPKMDLADIEDKLTTVFEKEAENVEIEKPIITAEVFAAVNNETEAELKEGFDATENPILSEETTIIEEELVEETIAEEPEKEAVFQPLFEITKDEVPQKIEKNDSKQISFEDLLGHNYNDLTFEKVSDKNPSIVHHLEELEDEKLEEESKLEELASSETENTNSEIEDFVAINETVEEPIVASFEEVTAPKSVALNENNAKTISFGLNDKIGFEKNLFGGSGEEMNRVISQISTFDTFEEAKDFIEDMVKPDYNNWDGKEDYALRFMEIVERKFE
jgi:hypothetical protein